MKRYWLPFIIGAAALAARPSTALQASGQSPDATAAGQSDTKAAPKHRRDRRVGKLHDQLRRQKKADDEDRAEASPGDPYAGYLRFKKELKDATGVTYQIQPGVMWQWGSPDGGANAAQFLWAPNLNWDIFDNDAIGQGSVQIGYFYNAYWTRPNGATMSSRLGLLSQSNDSASPNHLFTTLTYTQVFPGNLVQATAGQYSFGDFDWNPYAGNELTNFVNVALSQNASSSYATDGVGGYLQLNPTDELSIAAGGQNAGNLTGDTIEINTVGRGPWAWFVYGQWTPKLPFLPSSQSSRYGLLIYDRPSTPGERFSSIGWSVNAVQNLNANWGLFARANHSTGPIAPIATSIAGGVAYNNPFNLGKKDQIGVGVAWNATNKAVYTGDGVRASETVAEVYYNHAITRWLQVGPDVQIIFNPALCPRAGVLTFRVTGLI